MTGSVGVVGGLLLAALLPGAATAQQSGGELRHLAEELRPGDGIFVSMTNGQRIKADVGHLGPDSLTLSNGLTFAARDIRIIEVQDSLWTGAAIGLGVGLALLARQPVGSDSPAAVVSGVAFLRGLPAGVGAMIDASVHRTVYARTRGVQLTPTVTRGGLSASLSVGW